MTHSPEIDLKSTRFARWVQGPSRWVVLCFPLLLLSLIFELSSQTPAALSDSTPSAARENHQWLKLNQRIDRQIISGQTHYYQVRSRVGQFFSVEIEHWGMDLVGTFSSPSDHQKTDFVCSTDDITVVSVISKTDEEYTLALRAGGDNSTVSRYQIRLRELRPAAATDKDRLTLEMVLADAERLRRERKKESYKRALEKYQEARQRARALSDRVNEAKSLKNLAKTSEALNQTDEALTQYQQALTVSKTSKDLRLQADIANCLGYYYSSIGRNRDALNSANDALRLSRMAGSRSLEGQALFVLGEAHYGLGNVSRALEHYDRALAITRSLNDYQGQFHVLVNLGYTYSSLSDTVKAREACLEARALSVRAQNPFWEAKSLRALGIISTRLGEYQNALNYFLQALRIFDVIDDRLTQATVLAGIGFTYENLGEEKKALDYYNDAISIFQDKNPWGEAEAHMDVGRVHYTMGQTVQALESYQRALLLFRSLGITRLQAQTLRDMGLVYESSGDLIQALDFYNQSLALGRQGQDQRAVAYTLDYVGHIHERRGDRTKALSFYQQALRLNRLAADPGGEALTLFHIARAHRDLGNLAQALSQIEAGLKLSESLRTNVSSRDVRASFVASTHRYYELHADILMQLHRLRPEERFAEDALEATEKGRARSLVESLQEAHADIRQGVDPTLLQREILLLQALNTKAARRAQLTSDKDKHEAQAVEKEIDRLAIEHDEVWSQIKSNSPRYAALTQPQPLSLKEIQQQVLDDDTVLLEYMLGDQRSYLWAVTRTEVSSYELAGRAQIEEAVSQFRKSLTVNLPIRGETVEQHQTRMAEANARLPEEAAVLSKLIIGPVLGKLGTKRLLIVPDGALQYIPFQALTIPATNGAPGSDEQVPLLVDHEIVYEPSASTLALVLADSARRKPAPKSVAVFAYPVFEADDPRVKSTGGVAPQTSDSSKAKVQEAFRDIGFGDGKIPALPASREEAEAIMSVAPWGTGSKAIGFDASRETVMKPELAHYRIVHFATHGFVDYQHPELSGLVLSLVDQKGQPQDGFLRLHDIYNLKLSANLVVLSACNTGLGKEIKGEGMIGLTRGFMYAGATGVAASLWKVDDDATAELMKGFYEGIFKKGLTPAAALRESQLAMRQQKRWSAPYYWAAFIIQGQYDQKEEITSSRKPELAWLALWSGLASTALIGAFHLIRRRSRIL